MKENKSVETQEKILEAAIKIFSEKGYSAATTSEIAREAQVAEGTIFRYFPKKKDLLHGIVLKAIDIFGEIIAFSSLEKVIEESRKKPIEDLLKGIALDRVQLFEKYLPYIKVILYEIQFHEDVRKIFIEKLANRGIEIGKRIFEERRKTGEVKDVNSLIAVRSFVGMIIMMLLQRQFIPEKSDVESLEEEINTVIDIFLHGIKEK